MTYEMRSELRKECSRFLRFSYLIDFIGLDSLRTIYKESVNELLSDFEELIEFEKPLIFKERGQRPVGFKQKEPMYPFYLGFIYKLNTTLSTLSSSTTSSRTCPSSCPRRWAK